jgi:hypothetical protein
MDRPAPVTTFEYLQELRLRHQAGQLRDGREPDDLLPAAGLSPLERRWLKDAFQLVRAYQESVRLEFRTGLLAESMRPSRPSWTGHPTPLPWDLRPVQSLPGCSTVGWPAGVAGRLGRPDAGGGGGRSCAMTAGGS